MSKGIEELKKDYQVHKFMQKYRYQYHQSMVGDLAKLISHHNQVSISERDKEICEQLSYKVDVFSDACNKCAGALAQIRPQYPGGENRVVCPTCLDDMRLDVIGNLTLQSAPTKANQEGREK